MRALLRIALFVVLVSAIVWFVQERHFLQGRAAAETTQDVRTTAAIKARLAQDTQLSALDVAVDTTDGRVTLAGSVGSPEDLARLVRLALEHEGVVEVVSTVRMRPVRPAIAEVAAPNP